MEERRKRLLTDSDIQEIGRIVSSHVISCKWNFSQEDVTIIKNHLIIWRKATNIVGSVFLTALAVILLGIFTKGFWVSLFEGLKK